MSLLLGPKGSYTVQAGRFRHRVNIQQKTVTKDSAGGSVETWSNFATGVPAVIDSASGKENVVAGARQIAAVNSTEIAVRWRPGITETMRVVHGTDIYNIEGITPDSDTGRKILILICTLRRADGFRDG